MTCEKCADKELDVMEVGWEAHRQVSLAVIAVIAKLKEMVESDDPVASMAAAGLILDVFKRE
jgi:hypothetical protein